LLEQKDIIAEIDSWYLGFKNYMETNFLNGKNTLSSNAHVSGFYAALFRKEFV